MRIEYKREFLKQLVKLPRGVRVQIEKFVFDDLPKLEFISASRNLERLQGYSNCYKARFGNYRIGLIIEGDNINLCTVRHRREIYRYFP